MHKAYPGEEGNLVLMPLWDDEDGACDMISTLVEALNQVGSQCWLGSWRGEGHTPPPLTGHARTSHDEEGVCGMIGTLVERPSIR